MEEDSISCILGNNCSVGDIMENTTILNRTSTSNNSSSDLYRYELMTIYIPVFFVALFTNILIIIVVFKDQYMRNVTNYFLVNLSVADLLVTIICMPNAVWLDYSLIRRSNYFSCKFGTYFQCVSVASSIFTITTMAIDRYLAITRPFGFFNRCFNRKTTVIVIIGLWIATFIIFSPIPIIYNCAYQTYNLTNNTVQVAYCVEAWEELYVENAKQVFGVIWFVTVFVAPGVVMLFAYSMMSRTLCSVVPPFDDENEGMSCTKQRNRLIRDRKRVACILLLLAFVFAICWLPYHIVSLLGDLGFKQFEGDSTMKKYFLWLGHTNSALNPIIYCALSRKFRISIKKLLKEVFYVQFPFRRQNMGQWADSSGSGTQLHYLPKLKPVPPVNHLHFTISRRQSSQKTTKTCAV